MLLVWIMLDVNMQLYKLSGFLNLNSIVYLIEPETKLAGSDLDNLRNNVQCFTRLSPARV